MNINNTSERRLSMGQFAGLFLVTLVFSCFAFTRSFRLQKELPQEELNALREKQKIMESLGDLSVLLRQYETEQLTGAVTADDKEAEVREKIVVIRRELLHKDTATSYADIKKLLDMAAQYRFFIKKISKEGDQKIQVLNQQIADLQHQLQIGEMDKKSAQVQAQTAVLQAAKTGGGGGGGGGGSPSIAPVVAPVASGQPVVIPQTNTGNANCDQQVNQVKSQYNRACTSLRPSVTQIRSDVNNMSKGLFNKNTTERQSIERNLQQIERQLDALNN